MRASFARRGCESGFKDLRRRASVARSSFRLACVVGLVALALVAIGAPAASASGSLLGLNNDCGSTSQPFAQFGDDRYYTFGSNGGLENGSPPPAPRAGGTASRQQAVFLYSP